MPVKSRLGFYCGPGASKISLSIDFIDKDIVGGGNPVMAKQVTKIAVESDSIAESADESARIEPQNQQEVAALAYEFWQARGCPDGSPEQDWFRAERELQSRREQRLKAA